MVQASCNESYLFVDNRFEYSTYNERRLASENCIIDNMHCIVFSF